MRKMHCISNCKPRTIYALCAETSHTGVFLHRRVLRSSSLGNPPHTPEPKSLYHHPKRITRMHSKVWSQYKLKSDPEDKPEKPESAEDNPLAD